MRIALIVGVLLTTINQSAAVIIAGHATVATWVRSGLNFIVPSGAKRWTAQWAHPESPAAAQEPEITPDRPGARGTRNRQQGTIGGTGRVRLHQ